MPTTRHAIRLPLLLAIPACTGAPAPPSAAERSRYAALIADQSRSPTDALADCSELGDPRLRGDCQLAALTRADREFVGDLAGWCGVVDAGRTRDECWFIIAERRMRLEQSASAAEACGRSGGFEADCERHLWEQVVVSAVNRVPPPGWAAALPTLRAEFQHWQDLLPGVEDLPAHMWARFYERGLSRPGAPLDLRHCKPLPRADGQRCYEAGTALYKRRLAHRADTSGADLCARAPRSSAWPELQPAAPHPRLDAAVVELVAERCAPD